MLFSNSDVDTEVDADHSNEFEAEKFESSIDDGILTVEFASSLVFIANIQTNQFLLVNYISS
ncbi:hypothetical protein GCM10009000_087500 [Halobacterium noricense]|uniref:Uncharacterized protein n=1 Tax=Haladaptatus pallidirubidus TaxID=1008152 RepID=A0AAV3USL5_9EURY